LRGGGANGSNQFGPTRKSILASQHELGILQGEASTEDLRIRGARQPRMMILYSLNGFAGRLLVIAEKILGLFLELLKIGPGGQWLRHNNPLLLVPGVRITGGKKVEMLSFNEIGWA